MVSRNYKFQLPIKLRTKKGILDFSNRYSYKEKMKEQKLMKDASLAKRRGYFTKEEFVNLCVWKTQRQKSRYMQNEPEMVEKVSRIAFEKNCPEKLRIKIFTVLSGVKARVASALLHMAYLDSGIKGGYPLMDFRALGTLGFKKMKEKDYGDTDLWLAYTKFCRQKAKQYNVGMRDFDRALWEYNNKNQ